MADDTQDLLRLADEVAAATGSDWEMAGKIARHTLGLPDEAIQTADGWFNTSGRNGQEWKFPDYTASLDAAMTLVPEGQESAVLHDAWRAVSNGHALHIRFWKRETDGDYAQALARQITAAALKARAHSTKENTHVG